MQQYTFQRLIRGNMTTSYTLYYWAIPFRGNFIRTLLAYAGVSYKEATIPEIVAIRKLPVSAQPYPCMAPPFLHDHEEDLFLSQTVSIVHYLAQKLNLMPDSPLKSTLALKTMLDANDVIGELTRGTKGGPWTPEDLKKFLGARFVKWLTIFEQTGLRHGLRDNEGYYLETPNPTLADFVIFNLFGTMERCLPELSPILRQNAPRVLSLCDRIGALPSMSAFVKNQEELYGNLYCGGSMEESIRAALAQ